MGARCAAPCREEGLLKVPGEAAPGKAQMDTSFWQEKMRFSHSSRVLFSATVHGDAVAAAQAVRGHGDPNCCCARGYRPLQVAIACGNQEMVALLLKAGANINGHSRGTPPPLVLAAGSEEDKDGRLFQALLDAGADLNVADDLSGETALTRAAGIGQYGIVKAILSRGSSGFKKLLVQRPRSGPQGDGSTALHLAAANGSRVICEQLLAAAGDPNAFDRRGRLPLHRAVAGNNVEASYLLLSSGSAHSAQDQSGEAPLHLAAGNGRLALTDLLVRCRADLDCRRRDGLTPLHLAAQGGHDVICQVLTTHGAKPDLPDPKGATAFVMALTATHTRCCRVLLAAGAELKPLTSDRWVPPYTEFETRHHAVEDTDAIEMVAGC